MKIIHIITGLNNGGAEAVLHRLCKYDKVNENIVVSMMNMGKYGSLLTKENVEVYTLDMPIGKLTFSGILKLYKLLRLEKPDVVQTWMYHANLIGGIVAKIAGVKKIVWGIHHSSLDKKHNKSSTILIAKISAKLSRFVPSDIVFCAEKSYQVHENIGYKCKSMQVIPNGYELDKFYPKIENVEKLKIDLKLSDVKNIIGFVARFNELKDHDNLIQALKIVNQQENVKCLLIGADMVESNSALMEIINKYNVAENILLLGERTDISDIMNLLDIHILSSYSEAFPNVLCEAMACGTPCVTTDVGDSGFIVNNTGWVVPVKNSVELSKAILSAIEEKNENFEKFKKRQVNSREWIVDNFSISKMIDNYINIWSNKKENDVNK